MTTNEFIKAVKELGYEAGMDDEWVSIVYKNKTLAHIFTKELYGMSSYFSNIDCGENAGILFALIFQYASTPIKDREDRTRYYLRHKWVGYKRNYLIKPKMECKSYTFQNFDNSHERPTTERAKFTEKEIEEIKEKFDTDLSDFELVEVEDDTEI